MSFFKKWRKSKIDSAHAASMDVSATDADGKTTPPSTIWFNPIIEYIHSIAISPGFTLKSAPYLTLHISVDGSNLNVYEQPEPAKAVVTVHPDSTDPKELLCDITVKELFLHGILSINVTIQKFAPRGDLNPNDDASSPYLAETLFSNHQIVLLNDPLGYECLQCDHPLDPFSKLAITVSTPYLLTGDGRKVFASLPPRIEYDQNAPVTKAFLYALEHHYTHFLYIPLRLEFEMDEKVPVTLRLIDGAYKGAFPNGDGILTLTYKD